MLHGVDDTRSVVSVTEAQLSSLVGSIRDGGHAIVPLCELLEARARNAVALTFDDGFESVARVAAPLLRALGAPATLFLTTGHVGKTNRWPGQSDAVPTFPMMTWDDVARIAGHGVTIEAHGESHADLRKLDDQALEADLVGCKERIEAAVGRAPRVFAYPYGWLDRRVRDVVARHFDYAVTTKMGEVVDGDRFQVPRLDAYYVRSRDVHRWFGRRRFHAYLSARAAMRRLRAHEGEIEVEA